MANRRFEQFCYSLVKKKTTICGVVSLSAAGAILAQDIPGASISKTATGTYTIKLEDKYSRVLCVNASLGETSQDLHAKPGAVDVAVAKTVIIKTKTSAGVDADPSATAKLYVNIILSNSSVV